MHWDYVMTVAVVFNAGVLFTQFRYMRKSMVTKKDMELALLKQERKFDAKFQTKWGCNDKHQKFGGKAGAHAHD